MSKIKKEEIIKDDTVGLYCDCCTYSNNYYISLKGKIKNLLLNMHIPVKYITALTINLCLTYKIILYLLIKIALINAYFYYIRLSNKMLYKM